MASELQILIAGEPLDVAPNEDQEFNLSKVVHDLRDLETRNADFSTSITLPLTANNTRLLGSLVPSLARFVAAPITDVAVEVLAFGVPLIPDAFLVVTDEDAIGRTVTVNILGGNAKFFNQLKEEPLTALDLSSYDFEWTLADILAKDLVNKSVGLVVANCIWYNNASRRLYESKGGDDAETFLQHQELGESGFFFFVSTMLEEIFGGLNNLTVDVSKISSVISLKAFSVPVPIVHDSFGAVEGSYSEVQNLGQNIDDTVQQLQVLPYPIIIENPLGYWNAANDRYEFIEDGFFIVTVHIRGEFNGNNQSFTVLQNNSSIGSLFFPNTETGVSEPFEGDIVTTANVVAGDFISMNYSGAGTITAQVDFSSFSIEEQGTGRGRSFNVADMMPELSQKNFVKEVFKLFNFITTEANNVVTIHQFDEIRTEPPIQDVQLDISKEVSLANDLLTYGKTNIMKYSDNERVERLDADTEFTVLSTIIADKVVKINSLFFATDQSESPNTVPLIEGRSSVPNYDFLYQQVNDNKMSGANASLNYTTTERNDLVAGDLIAVNGLRRRVVVVVDNFTGQVDVAWPAVFNDFDWQFWRYSKFDGELHIADMRGSTGTNFVIWDGGISQAFAGDMRVAIFQENLRWNNLKEQFYSLIVDSVESPFIIVAFANISVVKFVAINGLQPIYIEEYKAYFYINKLEQWNLSNSVRLELIELKL